MRPSNAGIFVLVLLAFVAGFMTHVLYQRWNPNTPAAAILPADLSEPASPSQSPGYRVTFMPAISPNPTAEASASDLPLIVARDVEKLRSMIGQQARVRGRVFRVGHSAKSNTYFINFGPSREALTAIIFNSATELFEKNKQSPRQFENRDVEIVGQLKDHPQYGLEVILEHPRQIKILN